MTTSLQSAFGWSSASTVVRLALGFLSIKVTAVFLGPAGLALVGQVSNVYTLLQSVASGGAETAVVKMTAEAESNRPERANAVIGTGLRLTLAIGAVLGAAVAALHLPLSQELFGRADYGMVLLLLAVVLPIGMLGQLHTALFTARRRFELVAGTAILGTILGTAAFVAAAWQFGLWGGLIAAVAVYPINLVVAYWLGRRDPATRLFRFWGHADTSMLRPIASFYPALIVHCAALPLALVLIRGLMIETFGEAETGLWQATVRLSDMYTMVFLTALSMYSLPTLSAASRNEAEYSAILRRLVMLCLGAMLLVAATLFLAQDLIVWLVFTEEFAGLTTLWPWRLLGDVFLIAGWPLRSALMARSRHGLYIGFEFAIGAGMLALSWMLLSDLGVLAANVAHAVVWSTVFFALVIVHRRQLFTRTVSPHPSD